VSEPKLTERQWRSALEDAALGAPPDYFGDDGEWRPVEPMHVARYALSLLARVREIEAAVREVWESIPASYDPQDPMVQRHAAALNALAPIVRELIEGDPK